MTAPTDDDMTMCPACDGVGGNLYTDCPECHGVGVVFFAITRERDLPCPLHSDRACPRCNGRTVSVRWKGGQAIARCCECRAYVCSMPKRSIALALAHAARAA